MHTLSTRASSQAVPDPDDPSKVTARKVYYLACGFCRWTSRDVGMADQLVASGGWQDQENPNAQRIATLQDYYRQLAQREKQEREKKKYTRRRGYFHFSDKYGLTSVAAKRRGLMSMASLNLKEGEENQTLTVPAAEPLTDVEALPDSIYTEPLVLEKVSTLSQSLANPEYQPMARGDLYPRHKHLLVRRSQRCRECEHNLSKPEFNPSSIKFKIQLVALQHVPDIRMMPLPKLVYQKECQIILTLINPVENPTKVTLLPMEKTEESEDTATIVLPEAELALAARDDAAEYGEGTDQQDFQDDPNVVVWRKANKIRFTVKVIPQKAVGDVKVSLLMKYDYKNMTGALQAEKKEPQIASLEHQVFLNFGPVSA
ncbi:dynactin subunit 4 isoform X1 [Lingula anatina]|nr:dynactin subunit 4 isoform X1 [Lingula anatina]XP_013414819.1 dynactin subunit 4 isoform X1 [Lingula anatina]|eukprot:XP_013414818.1 dynactin subunit 4 isoform X1 [Lingula anatina]